MSRLSRRELLRFAGVGSSALALAACQPKVVEKVVERTVVVTEEKVVQETVVVKEQVEKEVVKIKDMTLLRWHHRLGTEWDMYAKAIEMYADVRPDVKVHEEVIPATNFEYGPKLVSMIAGGVAGDIAWMANGSGSFQFFASNEALVPLDDMVDADASGSILDGYYPEAVAMFRLGPGGVTTGSLYALPELAQAYPVFLFYNKDLFDAEGVPLPSDDWTRDDLLEAALKMTSGNRFGFLSVWDNLLLLRHHTLPYGLEPISDDGTKSRLDEADMQTCLRWLFDLFNVHRVSPRAQDIAGDSNQMFLGGQLAMLQGPSPSYPTFKTMIREQFAWDMVLMPTGPSGSRGQHLSGDGEGILKLSKNKAEAWEFIKMVTSYEPQMLLLMEIGLAARPDCFQDEAVRNEAWIQRSGQMIGTAARYLCAANFRQQEANTTIKAIFDPVANGEREADDAFFVEAHSELQRFLDKPREGVL